MAILPNPNHRRLENRPDAGHIIFNVSLRFAFVHNEDFDERAFEIFANCVERLHVVSGPQHHSKQKSPSPTRYCISAPRNSEANGSRLLQEFAEKLPLPFFDSLIVSHEQLSKGHFGAAGSTVNHHHL